MSQLHKSFCNVESFGNLFCENEYCVDYNIFYGDGVNTKFLTIFFSLDFSILKPTTAQIKNSEKQ